MKPILRFSFKAAIAVVISFILCSLISLIPGLEFNYALFAGGVIGILFINPKSNRVWKLISSKYGHNVGLTTMAIEAGFLQDKWENDNEGILVLTSLSNDGVILCRPHIIPYLRDTALIPWSELEVSNVKELTPIKEGQLVDQKAPMSAELKINGVHPKLEIPWNKELELFTNISLNSQAE